ncbi:MAG: hypothetical protein WBG42_14710 [Cryomorphaceae bacterium]
MKIRFLLVFGLVLWSLSSVAQMDPFLLLEKPGNTDSRIRYYPGGEISWKFFDDKTIYSSVIMVINDSAFVTEKALTVPYSEVEMIILPKRGVVRGIGSMAFYAIPPIIVLDALNNIFNTGRTPVVSEEALLISGVFGAITVVSWMMPTSKKYKLENKWRLIPIIH